MGGGKGCCQKFLFVADFDRVLQSMLSDGTFSEIVNRHVRGANG